MKKIMIIALVMIFSVFANGQVDRSKEVKAIVTERPAVEHFYSCPAGYELKVFTAATSTMTATYASNTTAWYIAPGDHYEQALAQDILRTGEPTCVPLPELDLSTGFTYCTTYTFAMPDGKVISLHLDSGKIEIPAGWPMDKAAKEFWEALKRYAKGETYVPSISTSPGK